MEERTIVSGVFTSNILGVVVEIIVGVFFALGFVLTIAIPFCAVISLGFVVFAIFAAIKNYNLKNQKIVVTNQRVYGLLSGNKIELPLDMISHIEARGTKGIAIFTASGSIVGHCCENRDEIVVAVSSLLKDRTANKTKAFEETETTTTQVSTADEIRKYKQLLDEGIITEEEFISKKNELLESNTI